MSMILAFIHRVFPRRKQPSQWAGAGRRSALRMFAAALWIMTLSGAVFAVPAQAIQNTATGTIGGTPLLVTNATVTLTRAGNAATSAVSEINPHTVASGSAGNILVYDILPTINAGDTGVDRVAVTAPAGYSALTVTGLSVGGVSQTSNCPSPGAGQYCAVTAGQVMTVTLGTKAAATSTTIRITFSATAPTAPGSASFSATVDDGSTASVPAQAAVGGDANGNNGDGNNQIVTVTAVALPSDLNSTVTAIPQIVLANGVDAATITTVLRDAANQPVTGKTVSLSSDRGADVLVQPASPTDTGGAATGTIRSTVVGVSTITSTDATDGLVLSARPQVFFTQGQVLELTKSASKREATVGDVISYVIEIRNKTASNITPVKVDDRIPPNFKYVKGSARLNGSVMNDPAGNRPLTFDIGVVPALVDSNGNGKADPGEPGYMTLTYQLVVGSGAKPRDYVNTAAAWDACEQCFISNPSEATVTVTLDPLFDLGTIIGKVFEDRNGDGWQDRDEPGVPGAMIVLDNGDYSITDEYGRYHFPAVKPGHRLVKINLLSLPPGSTVTTDEALVVSVTPGLLAKANFGVNTRRDTESIGRPGQAGIRIEGEAHERPVQVVGSAETLQLMINGTMAALPASDVRMSANGPYEIVELHNGTLAKPVRFLTEMSRPDLVASWELIVFDDKGNSLRTIIGRGALPRTILWDGRSDQKEMVHGGEIYQYQLEIRYTDGSRSTSARRIFGVNHTTSISLNLTGGAFTTGSAKLSRDAEAILGKIGEILRKYPDEKIIIEGHTDSVGSAKENFELSKQRAQSAISYLVSVEHIAEDRFVPMYYGMTKPLASNATAEGRALNRRVEIKGEAQEIDKARFIDEYRTAPAALINGAPAQVEDDGRFTAHAETDAKGPLRIEVMNAQGRSVETEVSIPRLEVIEPKGEYVVPVEAATGLRHENTQDDGKASAAAVLEQRLLGRTAKENTVELDGKPLTVAPDGMFTCPLELKRGINRFGLLVRNPQGFVRITMLTVTVADRDAKGHMIVSVRPIPKLSVKFPTKGELLKNPLLTVMGETDQGNRVEINGEPVNVQTDGRFVHLVKLPKGSSRVVVRVSDPEGDVGSIEREVTVADTQLFFLAFADGVVGRMHGKGYLDGAGMNKSTEYYTEGRVAYYLKGMIAGRYLITSAFDTGTQEFNKMFTNLDATENDRLFTNLDPDKIYPVYGDSSTLVNDAQSGGKFYLAVESDELRFLVGNYPMDLTDTELATYRRTLYGTRASYQSLSRTRYGNPDTQVVLFGAEARQTHVQDELRATGGSLYYLSHHDLIEGSEQVTLVIRDKNTGLLLSQIPQQENVDYTIKYPEGRILFNHPVSSVVQDATLINQSIQPGNPVFIQVDYECRVDSFKNTADGGHIRQQVGDHVALGGTYVKDQLQAGMYELQGVDTEVRLGKNTRVLGEYAETRGTNSSTFTSNDGGLTYGETTPTGILEGKAWKAAAETDVGEIFDAPDRVQVGGYVKKLESGFLTNGNNLERGSLKSGANMKLQLTQNDKVLARHDRDESEATATSYAGRTETSSVQYVHSRKSWEFTGEYQSVQTQATGTIPQDTASNIAARLLMKPTDKLTVSLLRQETLSGVENNQTTLGTAYQIFPPLSLEGNATQGTQGQSAQESLMYKTGNKQLYLTERFSDDRSGQFTSTIFGSSYQFAPSSKVYSEYQWEHSDAGSSDRTISLIGAQRQWDATQGLTFLLSGEQSNIRSKSENADRSSLAAGISYTDRSRLKAATRNEIRYETGTSRTIQYLTVNRLELKLNPDFTAIASYRYSRTRDRDQDRTTALFDERVIGLAYRPVAHDQFNALAKYTRLFDQSPPAAGATESVTTLTDVTSLEWSLQLSRYFEWVEKAAAKIKQENSGTAPAFKTHTYLFINRLNYNVWRKIDLGTEYRILTQREANDLRAGWLVEIMWKPVKHLRLGIGYNFTKFSDNEFSDNNYSVEGWFIRLQGKY
jgi:uncharacterized repeat protein (TIGR01451 family)